MKLYFSPGACSLAPHIVLKETGLAHEAEKVDLGSKKTASGGDYLAVNPLGYVPAVKLDNGEVLTEAGVIVQYLADLKPAAGLAPSVTLGGFASSSAAWLQETRRSAGDDAAYAETLLQRASDALSRETGVNIDEEMTTLLQLERSYQASSRLISTIDNMLKALLAVGR